MAYIIKKRDKYLQGHSYATGLGYRFTWTFNINEAQRFADDELREAEGMKNQTRSQIIHVPNTCKELRIKGKRLMEERSRRLAEV